MMIVGIDGRAPPSQIGKDRGGIGREPKFPALRIVTRWGERRRADQWVLYRRESGGARHGLAPQFTGGRFVAMLASSSISGDERNRSRAEAGRVPETLSTRWHAVFHLKGAKSDPVVGATTTATVQALFRVRGVARSSGDIELDIIDVKFEIRVVAGRRVPHAVSVCRHAMDPKGAKVTEWR